jgi:hypothetical protein
MKESYGCWKTIWKGDRTGNEEIRESRSHCPVCCYKTGTPSAARRFVIDRPDEYFYFRLIFPNFPSSEQTMALFSGAVSKRHENGAFVPS